MSCEDCKAKIFEPNGSASNAIVKFIKRMDKTYCDFFPEYFNRKDIRKNLVEKCEQHKTGEMCAECDLGLMKIFIRVRIFYTIRDFNLKIKNSDKDFSIKRLKQR